QQIQVFNGHTNAVFSAEYSPFVIKNSIGNSNVICSVSLDNTIRFWDIRSNKNQLYMIKGFKKKDNGIHCLKFILLKNKEKSKNVFYDLKSHSYLWIINFFVEQEVKVFLFENIEGLKDMFYFTLLFEKIEIAAFN
ncbi:hypothetical protein RFI_24632, partial [Reticulomyxa filosa]